MLQWGARSDVGLHRTVNEDRVLAVPPVFLVADGMGGHQAGDRASAAIAEVFTPTPDDEVTADWIVERFQRAHERARESGGGTTVAGAALVEESGEPYWLLFNIGDSRIYQLTSTELVQRSVDHSLVQELVDKGQLAVDEMGRHPQRNIITRAVGVAGAIRPDYWLTPVQPGERLLFCSDGLTTEVGVDEIEDLLRANPSPDQACTALVAAALDAGGRDNVSVVVVDVAPSNDPGLPEAPTEVWERTAPRDAWQQASPSTGADPS